MLIRRPPTKTGVCFAWTPKWTNEGLVWLEFVHWRYNDTEFGSYSYARWVPEDRYDAGNRRVYETPPGDPKKFCHNYRTNEQTPCHYPHCKWIDEDGEPRCNVDGLRFGEW